MNANGNGNGGTPWRWIAAICAAIMLAGAPGIVYALRTWGLNEQVGIIKERQDDVRIRLGILESQNDELRHQVELLRLALAQHIDTDVAMRRK